MILPFRLILAMIAISTGVATSYSVFAAEIYDRLDGKGPSGKRVDVIEWEGNLEVHAYPKGSLQGLSAKLDDRTEGKKVMVVGYRFGAKDHLVRRAVLGVPFTKSVMGFVDKTEKDFDKIALSNQKLGAPWTSYKLDPAPAQWFPDGDDREEASDPKEIPYLGVIKDEHGFRSPASFVEPAPTVGVPVEKIKASDLEKRDEGSINEFNW